MRLRAGLIGILGLAALAVGLLEVTGRGTLNPAIAPAEATAAEIAATTTTVYVALRSINAALSVAQEVEVGAAVVAQASVQPLRVLEPVDDTIERVADVVFAVAAGAALASVGVGPVAAIGFVLLGVGLVMIAAGSLKQKPAMGGLTPNTSHLAGVGQRVARLGAAFGVILPLGFAFGVALGERLTDAQWDQAFAELEAVQAEADLLIGVETDVAQDADDGGPAGDAGFLTRLGNQVFAAGEGVSDAVEAAARYRAALGIFWDNSEALFSALLTIIGIFALRMVVLPALLLWGALTLMKRSFEAA